MQRNYRGKRTDTKEWVYGYFVKAWDETCYIITEFGSCVTACDECGANDITAFEVIPETVGQSTGLKDKNGKEIYEGDIVRYTDYYYDQSGDNDVFINTGTVEYDDGSIAFYFTDRATATMEEVLDDEIEVVGTIFDNPELLQEV